MSERLVSRRWLLRGLGLFPCLTLPPVYAPTAIAHHGWSGFDQERPLYLEGRALEVKWRNPHAEVKLELSPELRLPADLASLPYPVQTAAVEGRALALRTTLPTRRDRVWDIELAPLPRLNQWRIEPIAVGSRIAVIGFTFSGERGDAVLRAEYLIVADRIYGLRSSPM